MASVHDWMRAQAVPPLLSDVLLPPSFPHATASVAQGLSMETQRAKKQQEHKK